MFGGLIQIMKVEHDYTKNFCTPLHILQNTFTNNIGCARSMGMVTIQCHFGITAGVLPEDDSTIDLNLYSSNTEIIRQYGQNPL